MEEDVTTLNCEIIHYVAHKQKWVCFQAHSCSIALKMLYAASVKKLVSVHCLCSVESFILVSGKA